MKETLMEIAMAAGRLLLENFGRVEAARVLKIKVARDYAIAADLLAEKNVLERLREAKIKCKVITEESGCVDLGNAGRILYLDPLDGTLNYSSGIPHFCTSIAMQEEGEMVLGIIYDPCRNELFVAEKGKGAFRNDEKIRVSEKRHLKDSFCALAFDYKNLKKSTQIEDRIRKVVRRVRVFGCAGLDFSWVACGRFDGYVDLALKPWDIAAGALLVEEAGGKVTGLKGSNWQSFPRGIVATNGALHKRLLEVIGK